MSYENYSNICRTCMSRNSEMKSIFIIENLLEGRAQISDILMECASIQVVKGDGLPEQLCIECSQELNRAFNFRKLCEKSELALKSYLNAPLNQIQSNNKNDTDNDPQAAEVLNQTYFENNYLLRDQSISFDDNKIDDDTCYDENIDSYNGDDDNIDEKEKIVIEAEIKEDKIRKKKLYTCSECNTKCYGLADYLRHIDDEHTKLFQCEVCYEEFKTDSLLSKHKESHELKESHEQKEEPIALGKRKKVTSRSVILKKRNLPRTCNTCNKTFRFHSNLERHKLTHTGEKPFLCNVCGKGFAQLSYLKIHSFIHTGEKPYECHLCDRSFAAPGTLMTHIRTHTGERPHVCKICGKDFPQSGYLSAHIRTHTGEKPVECKVCFRRFNQSGRLIIHMRIHSGEKPYACKDCGRTFAVKGTLKKHVRTHTGERPYVCKVCAQSFAQSGTLATHMKVHKAK